MTCGECRFAELSVLGETPVMECRRFPPQLFVLELEGEHNSDGTHMSQAVQSFPNVEVDDWCGEFVPADSGGSAS